ncbi:unnamed protein product [Mytilus coruscus]|uniref:Endonuclease/exonuclease/phosphatase domain-containing protein n=1 Tax=Mytilus coruscus TaxID=42192 RepID=A0A6J8ACZ7_MYTCO|nr:unnamed protein product [Mytilus coruscus]
MGWGSVRKKFDQYTELLLDRRNRIISIKLKYEKPLILICAYMPTRGSNTYDDYQAVLDEIAEIVEKYGATADIILGGDMNASLHRKDGISRDKTFAVRKSTQYRTCINRHGGKPILSFKNGKSPGELNKSAEHLKYGGSLLISVLAFIINFLFKHVHIPALIKSGIVCPVFKNGGKPKDDSNSYRKITITSSVGKVVEKIHLSRNEDKILVKQSNLQKGLTKGGSPCIAALIITELIIEAKKKKSEKSLRYIMAFGPLKRNCKTGLEGNNWLFFENWYTELTSKVKWKGELSRKIIEQ